MNTMPHGARPMRPTPTSLLGVALLATALAGAPAAHADPAADYQQGFEAYHTGDLPTAMRLLRRAADAGHGKAAAFLGWLLDFAEEDPDAVVMYQRAVELGAVEGAFGLGTMYAKGEGVEQDHARAVEWITKAADGGHGEAALMLGEAYLSGDLGLAADREQAIAWMERGAAAGYTPAANRLAEVKAQ